MRVFKILVVTNDHDHDPASVSGSIVFDHADVRIVDVAIEELGEPDEEERWDEAEL